MTPERIEKIYEELDKLVVSLDPDPSGRGTAYLQDIISKTRGYLNTTSALLTEVRRELQRLNRELDAHETAYEISSSDLLAKDNRVINLPSIDDRKSMISLLLRDEKKKILNLKAQVKDIGFVEKVVYHRHKELDNTMSAIRMQKSLIDTELRTGAYYGDETDTARGPKNYAANDINEEDLADLFTEVLETPAATTTTPAQEPFEDSPEEEAQPVVEAEAEEPNLELKQIENFISGDDYADIFSDISNS